MPNCQTKEEAIEYCYKHKNKFLSDMYAIEEDGVEQFDCLVSCIESGHIRPDQLVEYGMDYDD